MKESDLPSELTKFGVTRQETELFLLLSRVRNAGTKGVTGRQLAELAGLNRVRTYQLLDRLVDLGIVQAEFGRPKKYGAEDPQTAVRRLVALQESKLNELSLAEGAMAEALAQASPVTIEGERKGKEEPSKVAVLHGISAIQGLLKRSIEGKNVRMIANDESEAHLFTTVRYMSRKPRSARIVFASKDENREPFPGGRAVIEGYRYRIRLFRGDLPTVVLSGDRSLTLYYESQKYRPKPLSAMTVRTVVSSAVLIEGEKQVAQMETVFGKLWDLSA